jgi:tetrahydromethanopterin S-methyltransferase subunit G
MNQQFQTRFLLEDYDEFESLKDALLQLGASEDVAEMLTNAAAKGHIEPSKAIEIVKSTTGLSEDGVGGGSTIGGGVTNGASFATGDGEQHAGKKAFKEDAPMLAHGKADISTYTNDKFTRAEGHPKLKSIDIKNVWGTKPTAMSEMSNKNPGMPEFIAYIKDNPDAIQKLGFRRLQDVIEYLESASLEDWDELRSELSQIVGGKDIGIYEQDGLSENYHRFKRETRERPKQDQYHEAIRTVNKKLDEVNRILEFTSRMKNELAEEGGILEVKARTAKTMDKMKMKIAEAYKKLKNLN